MEELGFNGSTYLGYSPCHALIGLVSNPTTFKALDPLDLLKQTSTHDS